MAISPGDPDGPVLRALLAELAQAQARWVRLWLKAALDRFRQDVTAPESRSRWVTARDAKLRWQYGEHRPAETVAVYGDTRQQDRAGRRIELVARNDGAAAQ